MPTQAMLLVEEATPRHRLIFTLIAAALVAGAGAGFAYGPLPLTPVAAFLPAFAGALVVINLITAYLILSHAPLAGKPYLLWLGAGYLYAAAIVPAQMVVFPGVLAPDGLLGAGPQSAVWLWVLWHGGFPAFVLFALALSRLRRYSGLVAPIGPAAKVLAGLVPLAAAAGFLVLVTAGHDLLPPLIVKGNYLALSHSVAGVVVLVLNVAALLAVLVAMRGRTMMALGLGVAMVASTADVALTLEASARYTLGWYLSRLLALVTALSVLVVYLREVTWLYARISRRNIRLETEAVTDELTGLFNRRYFNRHLDVALRLARRRDPVTPTSLLLIDIDHFKAFNDHYGHPAGDRCLHLVARTIAAHAQRPGDCAARFGGEEFAAVLPETSAEAADAIAERLLAAVRNLAIPHAASATADHVTVSIGIATDRRGSGGDLLILEADQALYLAKAEGRDQARRHSMAPPL